MFPTCDRCGASAKWRSIHREGDLHWCEHHKNLFDREERGSLTKKALMVHRLDGK